MTNPKPTAEMKKTALQEFAEKWFPAFPLRDEDKRELARLVQKLDTMALNDFLTDIEGQTLTELQRRKRSSINQTSFLSDLAALLASEVERVIEERMKKITDEELEKEYSTDLATLCEIHNIPIKFDYLQGEMLEDFQYHNRLRHEGAKWFRNRIKGKQ